MKYPKNLIKRFYVDMLRIRVCEESFVRPISEGEVKCPVHLYSGEEAVAVGMCGALGKGDRLFGTHRSHGHFLACGGRMEELVAEVHGKASGCSRGRGGSMHLIDTEKGFMGAVPIVAGTISLAVGSALVSRIKKDGKVTVSFFGDGATGEGVLYESLNFAALKKLPVIFACENNLYSTHMPIKDIRSNGEIYKVAGPFGAASYRVDGNDVLKVYDTAREAASLCRKGKGPVFIEFLTYRMRGHVGPDDNVQGAHTDIRPAKEVEMWRKKDPILRLGKYLEKNSILSGEEMRKLKCMAEREVKKAHALALSSPFPGKEELTDHVFKK